MRALNVQTAASPRKVLQLSRDGKCVRSCQMKRSPRYSVPVPHSQSAVSFLSLLFSQSRTYALVYGEGFCAQSEPVPVVLPVTHMAAIRAAIKTATELTIVPTTS